MGSWEHSLASGRKEASLCSTRKGARSPSVHALALPPWNLVDCVSVTSLSQLGGLAISGLAPQNMEPTLLGRVRIKSHDDEFR